MERLRLQQWKTLNSRVEVAMESQRQQVAMSHKYLEADWHNAIGLWLDCSVLPCRQRSRYSGQPRR